MFTPVTLRRHLPVQSNMHVQLGRLRAPPMSSQPDLMSENPITELVESLHTAVAVLADIGLTGGDAAYVHEELAMLREQMRRLQVECHQTLKEGMGENKSALVRNAAGASYVLRRDPGKSPRPKLHDREGLVSHVLRAAPGVYPAHPSTGEVLHPAEAQVSALREGFLLEPRWGVLTKKYGAFQDDFATKPERTESVQIEKMEAVGG